MLRRLCISSGTGGLFAAGLDGLFEGGNPTSMGKSRAEAVGNLVLTNPSSFGLEIDEEKKEEPEKPRSAEG